MTYIPSAHSCLRFGCPHIDLGFNLVEPHHVLTGRLAPNPQPSSAIVSNATVVIDVSGIDLHRPLYVGRPKDASLEWLTATTCCRIATMLNISRFSTVIAIAAVFIGSTVAQRPNSASVCDYYAQALYGANSSDTQQRLVQNIVSLAFAGGANLTNVSYEITGILQPGQFQGVDIDLQPYFNGSKKSTNLNNEPISINWLDEGGREPLVAFLNGSSDTVPLTNSSNQ